MLRNETSVQHFLSRVEQGLNALNPNARPRNQRIFCFKVLNRESCSIALKSPRGMPIGSNLSFLDLFSFDVQHDGLRANFESVFAKYEARIAMDTRSLLSKLKAGRNDIGGEIIDLFAAKILNFVRNPFCIPKVLASFPSLAAFEPTNASLRASYRSVLIGRRPHQTHLCAELGITDVQYVDWLRLLFMLLVPMADGKSNFFEETIKGLLEDKNSYIAAFVHEFYKSGCLLSDRGFSQPIEDGPHTAFSFNLCATAFIDYVFADPAPILQGKASPAFVAQAIENYRRLPEKNVHVTFVRNNLDMLARFNRRAIEQCHEHVFCAINAGIVL